MVLKEVVLFNSASSGGGGSRGAPQHYPKTAGNRYGEMIKQQFESPNSDDLAKE